ncbi:MAG TPA: PHB depolymerase family esterase [Gemmatimonadaceae bacterium]|nr:PHB depolymerase family esterase [Gemmatimonadaceae bacterium]
MRLRTAAVGAILAPAVATASLAQGGGARGEAPVGHAASVGQLQPQTGSTVARAGSAAPAERNTVTTTPMTTRVIRGTFRNAAGERPYVLHIPEGEAPAAGRPLVVMLHGCTQDADDIARGTRLHDVAGGRGWMVLYPEQPLAFNPKKCWNWFDPGHQRRDAGEPSLIAGMTAQAVAEHGGDASRVFLAGISAGAAMASLVAAAYPEQYAALALHSGLAHGAARTVMDAVAVMQRGVASPEPFAEGAFASMGARARIVPTLVIHGEADAVVAPINGAQAAKQWFLTNALAKGQPLDTTSGGTDRVVTTEGGYRVTRSTYRAKDGLPLAWLVMVKELGHAWSGGSTDGTFTDPKGPSASALVTDFFAAHAAVPAKR